MEDQVPMDEAAEVVVDTDDQDYGGEQTVLGEFRTLGEHFVAAMRAAASTAEAEALKNEVQEGMRTLRDEIDTGLKSAKSTAAERKAAGRSGDQLRNELAGALRSVNRVLERFAASMDAPESAGGDAAAPSQDEDGE